MNANNELKRIQILCPTHWAIRVESCSSALNGRDQPIDFQKWSFIKIQDIEMQVRIAGVQAQLTTFKFCFACLLRAMVLSQTDNLKKKLSKSNKIQHNLTLKRDWNLQKLLLELLKKINEESEIRFHLLQDTVNKKRRRGNQKV